MGQKISVTYDLNTKGKKINSRFGDDNDSTKKLAATATRYDSILDTVDWKDSPYHRGFFGEPMFDEDSIFEDFEELDDIPDEFFQQLYYDDNYNPNRKDKKYHETAFLKAAENYLKQRTNYLNSKKLGFKRTSSYTIKSHILYQLIFIIKNLLNILILFSILFFC